MAGSKKIVTPEELEEEAQETIRQEQRRMKNEIINFISGNPIWQQIAKQLLEENDLVEETPETENIEEQFQQFLEWKKTRGEPE